MANRYFTPATLSFLRKLARNNQRDWFEQNKTDYEETVRTPALQFITDMADDLAVLSPHFLAQARKVGGSLMRVHRDVRFGTDKRPYKTNIGIQFRHEQAKDVHAPGYYVHIEPQEAFLGIGMWRPDPEPLRAIRARIAAKPAQWQRALQDPGFRRHFELGGESLRRPPRGFAADHECIEDIKRKSFIAFKSLDPDACLAPQFQRRVETAFGAAEPFMRFLCKAVGVPF